MKQLKRRGREEQKVSRRIIDWDKVARECHELVGKYWRVHEYFHRGERIEVTLKGKEDPPEKDRYQDE